MPVRVLRFSRRTKRSALGLLTFMLLALAGAPAQARRVALVIGNGTYTHATPLANPRQDATDVGASFRDLGFQVDLGLDLTQAEMIEALNRFLARSDGAEAALVYFAGHGIQVSGRNFLLPTDVELTAKGLGDRSGLAVDDVLQRLEKRARTSIVILDSCRDDPFGGTIARLGSHPARIAAEVAPGGGFARMRTGLGSAVIFATQPDNVALDGTGRNSPFTAAFLKHVRLPDQDLSGMMIAVRRDVSAQTDGRQIPWEHSALFERFYFSGRDAGARAEASSPLALQQALWETVRTSRERSLIEAFLRRFPQGREAEEAEILLASLPPDPGTALPKAHAAAARAQKTDQAPTGACDQMARHPDDGTPDVPGVPLDIVRQNAAEAVAVCARALADHPDSPRIAGLLARAIYARGDRAEAAARFAKAAEAGDRRAMAALATLLSSGDGIAKDDVLAARWHGAAADLGLVSSMVNLGLMFEHGQGVTKSAGDAAHWYAKAAETGHARALYNLAGLTMRGDGVRRNTVEAIALYERAAAGGEGAAMTALGDAYFEGKGVPADPAKALDWFRKAEAAGETLATERLGYAMILGKGTAKNAVEGARYYRKAAEAGHAAAAFGFARLLAEGIGLAANPAEAALWYRRALDGGDTRALLALARLADTGRGVARDPGSAASGMITALETNAEGARAEIIDRWQSWSAPTRITVQRLLQSRNLLAGRPGGAMTPELRAALSSLGR